MKIHSFGFQSRLNSVTVAITESFVCSFDTSLDFSDNELQILSQNMETKLSLFVANNHPLLIHDSNSCCSIEESSSSRKRKEIY
jgi:hypothetical protein